MTPNASPFWSRSVHADRRPLLLARARTFSAWRKWFAERDFLEVDTAALQVSPGNEAHIGAFETAFEGPQGRAPLYLHTSPEFACKKLLAAGEERIFSLAHVFRNGERGPLHHPEFTMLEWYRAREATAPSSTTPRRCVRSQPTRRERAHSPIAEASATPSFPRKGSASATPSFVSRAWTSPRPFGPMARTTATDLPPWRQVSASASRRTIRGATSSARS